jgi:hypothetical protein
MENENGYDETLNHQDTEADIELDLDIEDTQDDDETDYKTEAEKAKELANNYKIRAEKAESKLKQGIKPEIKQGSKSELSTMEAMLIMKSNIDIQDVEAVTKFAKMEGISISEALKSDELRAIIAVKNEKRNVAEASHSGTSRRSSPKVSDDSLLANASKGILPDTDEDFHRLQELRSKRK